MTAVAAERSDAVQRLVESWEAFTHDDGVGSSAPAPVRSMRQAAIERFREMGFPTMKNEDWHFTSVAPILEHEYLVKPPASDEVSREQIAPFLFGASEWHTMVFVNGHFAPELSDLAAVPDGVRVTSLARAWQDEPDTVARLGRISAYDDHAFSALNTAFMHDGAVVHVAKDTVVDRPIHLLFVTDADAASAMLHPRNLVVLGRHAKATVLESYVTLGDASYLVNALTEVAIGDGATLTHYRTQREGMRAYHVGTVEATQGRDSHFVSFSFASGGALSRVNVYTKLDGAGCGATLNGLYMLAGEQHCDHQTSIVHAQPNCYSRELYKGVLDGRSHGVFNGKVYVHPIAQQTDGKQTNNTLLLSPTAQIDTKPQLEIYADDVKCTHGATIGRLDDTALFYMKSRGVGARLARELLTYAFAADVIETIELEPVREAFERLTLQRFTGAE